MRRNWTAALLLVAGVAAEAGAGEVQLDGRKFTLPDGFTIEQIAGPPLVDRPIVADFDEQGRLYVADSSGSSDNVQKQLAEKPHRVVRLEDSDGDGRFDRRTVFADKLMFPEGALWFDGSLYVAAPPSIWKFTDTDGDGVADQRVEWFQGKTLTGCANDLHGPYLGRDGWIYWCKGAFAEQTYEQSGHKPLVTRASHIFRCRPDGSGIEPVMTGGMDNPVDVVFTPTGERIFTTTFLVHPGGGQRDGLIHAVYGGVYGKVHDVLNGHKRTSPDVMPVLVHLGPAAPCGLAHYDSAVFGPDFRNNLFATLFNMHKVTRHVLKPDGATFSAATSDFVVCDSLDFHPTDVHEDADGSLVILDTGGWYKLCCPTSQLVKPDVLGAIYRVRRKDIGKVNDPRGLQLKWSSLKNAELAALLDDPRPAVQRRAIETLAKRGDNAVEAVADTIKTGRSPEARRNAVWTATRINHDSARAAVREALRDDDDSVIHAAAHSISVRKDADAVPRLSQILDAGIAKELRPGTSSTRIANHQVARAIAEALGRIGNASAVSTLATGARLNSHDRTLLHSCTYALIEIDDPVATRRELEQGVGRPLPMSSAILIALDQMDGGGLDASTVASYLASDDPGTKAAAGWIVSRHPEWAEQLSGFLRDRLAKKGLPTADREELERLLVQFARAKPIQDLLADRLRDTTAPTESRLVVLRTMAQSGLKQVPAGWIAALTSALTTTDSQLTRQAVATARALPLKADAARELGASLLTIGGKESAAADTRLDALAAVPGGLSEVSAPLFAFLIGALNPDQPVSNRSSAAEVLSKARLTHDQFLSVTDALKTAGPLEAERLIAACERSRNQAVGLRLIAALKQSPARASLRTETLKPHLAKFDAKVRKEAESLYAALDADLGKQRAKLEEMAATLKPGDIRRGQLVFNGSKASCSACHAIGYMGGRVGPDLTRIGGIRSERDLLESIVFPSASFVRSFEPVIIATRDGKAHSGLPRKDAPDEIILATGPNEEVRIPRDEIEEMRPGTVSVMPAGLDQQLSRQDLADLVAFLKACR
jgi:putative membrane-bound dehydrogenase-like protein